MITRDVWTIDNTVVDKLRGPLLSDSEGDQPYAEMQAAVEEIKNSEASKDYDAELTARPPSWSTRSS
jgi:hypothetical protein